MPSFGLPVVGKARWCAGWVKGHAGEVNIKQPKCEGCQLKQPNLRRILDGQAGGSLRAQPPSMQYAEDSDDEDGQTLQALQKTAAETGKPCKRCKNPAVPPGPPRLVRRLFEAGGTNKT